MVRRSVLVVAITSAACIKLAEFHPLGGDAGGDGPVMTADAALPGECGNGGSDMATAMMSGSATICAAGPGYVLRFPPTGFHYPDQLRIGSAQVLGKANACNEEADIGMEAYPLPPFAAETTATGETGSATILLAGPVVAKVAVSWSWHAPSACVQNSSTNPMSGLSTFTLFPDGRLVRFDQLTTAPANSVAPCDCGSGAQLFGVDTYISFAQGQSPVIKDQSGTTVAPDTGAGSGAPQLACVSGSDWGVGIAQILPTGRARVEAGGDIALTHDYSFGMTALGGGINPTIWAYQISNAPCTAAQLAPIEQFSESSGPNLRVQRPGGATPYDNTIGTGNDGTYGGDPASPPGLPVGAGTVTLTPRTGDTIPGGWALWVGGVTLHNPVANPARTGDWYKIQNSGSDGILWVRDALGSGDTITVTAQ